MNRILISLLACLLLCVALLWWQLDRRTEALGSIRSDLFQATARAESLSNTLRIQRELTTDAEHLDRQHTLELSDAQAENERLRDDIGAGNKRLRVNASCPAVRVPETASATGVDDARTAELAASARQDYFTLRRQLTTTEHALTGLQEWVSAFCR